MKDISKKKQDFNEFRFAGLNAHQYSNKYLTMKRINEEKTKIVVKVAENHIRTTKFGHLIILDNSHVIFIKDWQINRNFYGSEVIFDKQFFHAREFGDWEEFGADDTYLSFDGWLKVAEAQSKLDDDGTPINMVHWEI